MSPEMTDFDFIPGAAARELCEAPFPGRFFDKLRAVRRLRTALFHSL